MKSSKFRMLVVIGMITISVFSGLALKLPEITVPTSKETSPNKEKFEQENMMVNTDLSNIDLHQKNINVLEAKLKADTKAGLKSEMINDKKELMKMKANLKRDKAYLLADKKMLMKNYKAEICADKAAVKNDKIKLKASERKLRNDMSRKSDGALQNDAAIVAQHQRLLKKDVTTLNNERVAFNSDIIAMNKKINKSNGQFVGVTAMESTYAHVSNSMKSK